ncbi:hypothetical protein AcW1_000735 [Taiwanofungus camphoratus]|nr:hypothetical protein AcW2_000763 [Antrodia cinnamomea]KAI0961733.1 hypothetical protein AcV7_000755 [Antrodia cinnamomea]KAI0963744.1 hypothetical protein AcW1_000735 [Antrodia cinnamomea]
MFCCNICTPIVQLSPTTFKYFYSAMTIVPLELCDYIIDFLHNDRRALAACSLTCRAWLPAARFHLFDSIVLYNARLCTAFNRLLENSPALGLYVRELSIAKLSSSGRLEEDAAELSFVQRLLPSIFRHLVQLKSLGLSLLDVNVTIRSSLAQRLSVTELVLQYCQFPAFADFLLLFYSFPQLQSLTVRGVTWMAGFVGLHPRSTVAPRLRKLVLGRDIDIEALVKWMLVGSHYHDIESISMCCTSEGDASAVGPLLEALGPSLKHLELDWYRSTIKNVSLPSAFAIHHCTSLNTVSLRCVISYECTLPWVTSFLSDLNSTQIRKIAFEIRLLGSLDALDWEAIGGLLSEPRFSNLRTVLFKVVLWSGVYFNQAEVKSLIRYRLSNLDSKGLIQFTS